MCTPKIREGKKLPKFGAILGNFRLQYLWNGSRYRQAENGVINYNSSHLQQSTGRFGKLWSANQKFRRLMLTHQKLTLLVLYRLMQLRLGHVTLLGAEFQSPKLSCRLDLRRRAASRWALPQISSFIALFFNFMCYWQLFPVLVTGCSGF